MGIMDTYRFNDATGEIHKYSSEQGAYLFFGSYHQHGIKDSYSDRRKTDILEGRIPAKQKRVKIDAWGITGKMAQELKGLIQGYAVVKSYEVSKDAIMRSITRRTGLHCATMRFEGHVMSGDNSGNLHYSATLARPASGGGWDPVTPVWFSIPASRA